MLTFKVKFDVDYTREIIRNRKELAEHAVAESAMKDTVPFVPMDTGSQVARTRVIGNQIVYEGPYARYLYYGKVMVDATTGKGPRHYVDKNGNEVIRSPFGSKLVPTNRELNISTAAHPRAQSHWFEASKAENLKKWLAVAKEVMSDGE